LIEPRHILSVNGSSNDKRIKSTLLIPSDYRSTHAKYQSKNPRLSYTWLIVVYDIGHVRIWDLLTGDCICLFGCEYTTPPSGSFPPPLVKINAVAMLNDGRLITSSNDGKLRIWRLDPIRQPASVPSCTTEYVHRKSSSLVKSVCLKVLTPPLLFDTIKVFYTPHLNPADDVQGCDTSINVLVHLDDGKLLAKGKFGIYLFNPSYY
jgi:WD40 repeat protein